MLDIKKETKQLISDEERASRLEAVTFANANLALEGLKVSKEQEERAMRYVNGEMTLEEFANGEK